MLKRTQAIALALALSAGALAVTAEPARAVPAANPLTTAVAAADRAVAVGLGPAERYERQQIHPWSNGLYSVAYERTYRGLSVIGGDVVVLVDGTGVVREWNSATEAHVNVPTTATVTAAEAATISGTQLSKVDAIEAPHLVVYIHGDTPKLAWQSVAHGQSDERPSSRTVWIDARTGDVLGDREDARFGSGYGSWNGPPPVHVDTTHTGATYAMRDPLRPGLTCADYPTGVVLTDTDDVWGNGSHTDKATACVDAMFAVQKQWDMLINWAGTYGPLGNGTLGPILVAPSLQDTLYWDGTRLVVGRSSATGEYLTHMDILTHEFGHAIDQRTPGGPATPAVGEATGDIFGTLTEQYANEPAPYDVPDYLIGEDTRLVGNRPLRSMYNPGEYGDPNCYSSAIPNLEPHQGAGPFNHWFYLLAEGSNPGNGNPKSPTCDNSVVTGIGAKLAARLFYGAMLLKTSGMTYQKYRTATLQSARNLDVSCGLYDRVRAAWDAVSVRASHAEPVCTPSG